jgi:Icc-related predicted phosphoesterase
MVPVSLAFFVSDLHGRVERYEALFRLVEEEKPGAVFLGGDLLPFGGFATWEPDEEGRDFLGDFLARGFEVLRKRLGRDYPEVFLILGNDDPRSEEPRLLDLAREGLWRYGHGRRLDLGGQPVLGYSCVPPTPFHFKDWERYDVSRFVDLGCVSPEEGHRSVELPSGEIRHGTIEKDLAELGGEVEMDRAILLFHTPPYRTKLDRAALDGKKIDHVELDVHVGSIAVRRFIETRQPLLALHGHIHESARLTGCWRDRIGRTELFSAAHDGPELALIRFDPGDPAGAERELI